MDNRTVKVLVVEDEREIRELMALHILRQGFRVVECASSEAGLEELQKGSFDLLVVDWMLPGLSGIDLIRNLRMDNPLLSILMVTARTEPEDIVQGLDAGADDYLQKPFEPNVFLARVKALVRKSLALSKPSSEPKEVLHHLGLEINHRTYEVNLHSRPLHLTPSEFKLLAAMVQNAGRVMTRDSLIGNIQGEGINVVGRTIDTHVFGLRKKLEEWSDNIETIRGIGYRVRISESL